MECNIQQCAGRYLKKYISLHTHIRTANSPHSCVLIFLGFLFFIFFPCRTLHPFTQKIVCVCVLMKCAVLCFAHLNYHLISLSFMICYVCACVYVCMSHTKKNHPEKMQVHTYCSVERSSVLGKSVCVCLYK